MYFKDKDNTNIDDEFDDGNILSKILNILNKYKLIIIIALILIFVIVFILLFSNRKVTNYLALEGEEYITIYQNEDYIEPGYDAYNSKNQQLNNQVKVLTNIDTSKVGEYEITYSLGEITKTRKVKVIEKPKEYTYIYLKSVNDSINVYLKVGEEYIEPGYKVYSTTGKDYTSKVKVTGSVDTTKKGSYQLVYSLIDENGVTINETRTIIVMDSEIGLSLSTTEYTNKDITINVNVIDNYFEYLILPDGNKVNKSTYEYVVNQNGTYTFETRNKKGLTKEESITVSNIDKTEPTGTCTGKYGNGKTTLTINAKDSSGIRKYIIDNKSYMKNIITLYEEKKNANVTIQDNSGNTKTISCNITKDNLSGSVSSSSSSNKPSSSNNQQSSNAPTIVNIAKDGVLINITAQKKQADIAGYYFSYTNKRPNKNGAYVKTSNTTLQVARLPGTTYVWVEDTNGNISAYKTITIDNSVVINTKGKILQGTTLKTALERKGGSKTEFNKLIARSAMAAGLYTKEAAATTAVTLIGVLDKQYGVRLPYRAGGKNTYYGVSNIWGEKINDANYPYRGFDCDGFTHWSYFNAGLKIKVTTTKENYWYWDRIPFSKEEAEIGDIISQYKPTAHVKIIVGKTDTGFIVAHANGKSNGVWINVHPYTDTEGFTLIKGSEIASYYEKDTTSYPPAF